VGSGSTSGVVPDDTERFKLDNVESEVVGGTCGVSDGGDINKNGWNN